MASTRPAAAAAAGPRAASPSIVPSLFVRPSLPSDVITDDEWVEQWTSVLLLLDDILAQLLSILQRPDNTSHYSVPLHILALVCRHRPCADFLLNHATRCLPLIDRALGQVASLVVQHCTAASAPLHSKPSDRLHVRPYCLPSTCNRLSIGVIRSADVGRLICVLGNVMRVQAARMYEYASEWQCDKCGGRFYAYADDDQESRMERPKYCRASEQPEANKENASWQSNKRVCRSTFINQTPTSLARDVQHVRIQDNLHRSHLSLPRSITLRLTDEQCESVKVGDVVQVCGMVRRQWSPLVVGQRVNIDLYLDAYHIAVIGSSAASAAAASTAPNVPSIEFDTYWQQQRLMGRGLKARNQILSAMAPTLVGMFIPKLTCMLALIGGVKKEDGVGTEGEEEAGRNDVINLRGDIHVLMVGDAGVGKSVLLQSACGLSPRGVLTTGAGTTSAGLTVAATRAAGSRSSTAFTLEPGALVLADSGVCCIDEFNCISKSDRTSLLEAMEQQTISIAKGGQVTKLNTRTAVIAALNPKQGKYDHDLDLSVNTALGSALLSRFDVILALLDTRDETWDEKVAEQLLQVLPTASSMDGVGVKKQEKDELLPDELKDDEDEVVGMTQRSTQRLAMTFTQPAASASQLLTMRWSVATVHSYIAYLKSSFFPVLSPACESLLKRYYQQQRRSDGRKQARVGVRLLESLIRLTQAHARLMWRRDECELLDAVMAVVVMEHSVLSCGLLAQRKTNMLTWGSVMPTTVSALHAEFSATPDNEYELWETMILDRLELSHLRHSTQSPPDNGRAGEHEAVYQQPTVYTLQSAGQQKRPNTSLPISWPLPPSMALPLTSAPPPPPANRSLHASAPSTQAPIVPPLPSQHHVHPLPVSTQPSSAPTHPLPPAPRQPPNAAVAPAPSPVPPASILKAPSLAGVPPPGRLLSRKSTVSFATAPPPSPLSASSTLASTPTPSAAIGTMPQPSHAVADFSQPDIFTLPPSLPQSPPQSPSRRLRASNPFTAQVTPLPTASPASLVPSQTAAHVLPPTPSHQPAARNNPNDPIATVSQQPPASVTPLRPTQPPSTRSTPTSRPPLAPLHTPSSTTSNLPNLPSTPVTVPSPLSAMRDAARPLPLPRGSSSTSVSAVSLSSSFAAAIKANPFIVRGGDTGSGGSRWSTGITDEELDGLDLNM